MSVTTKMTAEQYLELGEDTDGLRRELLEGEIVVSPSATPEHSDIVFELASQLRAYVKANRLGIVLGDLDTKIGDHDVPRPDILYFGTTREQMVGRQRSETVPDLAIEVLSPGNAQTDRKYKFKLYAQGDVPCYWMVDPRKRTLEAYQLANGTYQLVVEARDDQVFSAPPLPELKIELAELWWRGSE